MTTCYAIISIFILLASIFVIPTNKLSKLQSLRVVIWGLLSSVWFFLFPIVLNAQLVGLEIKSNFISAFHIIAVLISIVPAVVAFVMLFIKSQRIKNYSFFVSIFLLICVDATLIYTALKNYEVFAPYTVPYLAINFPLMLALSLFLNPAKKIQKIILLICYGVYAIAGIAALVLFYISAKDYLTIDTTLLIIAAIIIGVPAASIATTLIEKPE